MDDFRDEDLHIEDFDENGNPIIAKKKPVHGDDDYDEDASDDDFLGEDNFEALGLSDDSFE